MKLRNKLCISTIDNKAGELARKEGLGIELADFCWAMSLEENFEENLTAAKEKIRGIDRVWLHAPFAELSPAAIDPAIREHTAHRYRQTIDCARRLGIRNLVIHSGYIPLVYFPEWFVPESVKFWKAFLQEVPEDMTIALENVMEPDWNITLDISRGVEDPRFGLCLDVGHAGTCVSEKPPLEWIAPMAPYLKHIHLHNNEGDWDLHAPLGVGKIPMDGILETALKLCPEADFALENPDTTEESLQWLQARGYL